MSHFPSTKRHVLTSASSQREREYTKSVSNSSLRSSDARDSEIRKGSDHTHTDGRSRNEPTKRATELSIPAGSYRAASPVPATIPEVTVSMPDRTSSRQEGRKDSKVPSPSDGAMESSLHLSDRTRRSRSDSESGSYETSGTPLPPLQTRGHIDDNDILEPLAEEDYEEGSFDLLAPANESSKQYSLEERSEQLFSTEHLRVIFEEPALLLKFTSYLSRYRQKSIPILIYYLDAVKALRAISYANAIIESLEPMPGYEFSESTARATVNHVLEDKARQAFDVLAREDLPAYITHTWTQTVSLSITRRISGTLPIHLREASEGLAEVFCLTDPSRQDNPIVFASEEFHRTTQYGMNYVIGRNCRFLQGPKTNPFSVRRLRQKIEAGQEHCEVFLNYRRDGSAFMNLLMTAPLCDSRGKIRYFIGAQVDISGLVKDCSDLESLSKLVASQRPHDITDDIDNKKDEFQQLSEMLNMQELNTVRRWGGRMHKEQQEEVHDSNGNSSNWAKPRLLIHDASPDGLSANPLGSRVSGRLSGVYEHYLLVRPYPSLRILFSSPSLRVPGILQSPFMAKIGGSPRVREELTQALADGRGVTAKVKWVTKGDSEGRNRWIHCTPLLGSNGAIGVWMVVIVDSESESTTGRRFRQAPPVEARVPKHGPNPAGERVVNFDRRSTIGTTDEEMSLRDFALQNGGESEAGQHSMAGDRESTLGSRSGSPWTLRLDRNADTGVASVEFERAAR